MMTIVQGLAEKSELLIKQFGKIPQNEWSSQFKDISEGVLDLVKNNEPFSDDLIILIARSMVYWTTEESIPVMQILWSLAVNSN
jgi:hypothetical protein